jgi:prophage maintenance system killer protein
VSDGAIDYLSVEDLLEVASGVMREVAVRDSGLLAAAAARPAITVFGDDAYPTFPHKAAALLHSLVRNHALVDGNKRLAWSATRVFCLINGRDLTYTVDEAEETGRVVQAMHRRVRGKTPATYGPIPKGTRYDASDPQLGLWVLASVADSALVYYQRVFGDLTQSERERYWSEYRQVGELLGLPPDSMPATHEGLRRYIDGARAKGARPVLATSVERRKFDASGNAVPTHGDYPAAMRALAGEESVALLDIQALSIALWQELGVEETKKYFNWTATEQDNTHFNPPGAIAVARLVAAELVRSRVLARRDVRRLDDAIPESWITWPPAVA